MRLKSQAYLGTVMDPILRGLYSDCEVWTVGPSLAEVPRASRHQRKSLGEKTKQIVLEEGIDFRRMPGRQKKRQEDSKGMVGSEKVSSVSDHGSIVV